MMILPSVQQYHAPVVDTESISLTDTLFVGAVCCWLRLRGPRNLKGYGLTVNLCGCDLDLAEIRGEIRDPAVHSLLQLRHR